MADWGYTEGFAGRLCRLPRVVGPGLKARVMVKQI